MKAGKIRRDEEMKKEMKAWQKEINNEMKLRVRREVVDYEGKKCRRGIKTLKDRRWS